ncbi:MAG: FAD-dependent oxidoreductase [Sphaerochaetaceae bacterium]|nr:FAD-dependent oxidoreductase [Spirochaetales bacterium]MDY5500477.1 FAD-dependent oxidoreductase [Sphaerochaetaceae bacterium]
MRTHFDLIVVGGGIAGSLCATSAAREGVSVLLVEESGCLGGSLTICGTGPMMTFHAGDLQVIRGITDELVGRLKAKGLSVGHIPDSTGYTYTVTPFDAEGMKHELELMASEAGVMILFHTMLASTKVSGDKIEHLTLLSCGSQFTVDAPLYVDATGDADLLVQAGVPVVLGRENDHATQPMTTNFKLEGVDIGLIRDLMGKDVSIFPFLKHHPGREKQAVRLSCSGFQSIMRQGIKEGRITFDRDIVLFFETNTKNEIIVNMTRVNGFNPVDPMELSKAEMEGRRQVWELYRFLKDRIPGFQNAKMVSSGPSIGIRSSRSMQGVYTITADDILSERVFDDRIAVYGYPIDIHSPDGTETKSIFLRDGGRYTIPYRILVNRTVENVMATGRLVSASFEAQASLRTSPCCGALGQACGIAAAIAIQSGKSPLDIDVDQLQKRLRMKGAYLE